MPRFRAARSGEERVSLLGKRAAITVEQRTSGVFGMRRYAPATRRGAEGHAASGATNPSFHDGVFEGLLPEPFGCRIGQLLRCAHAGTPVIQPA